MIKFGKMIVAKQYAVTLLQLLYKNFSVRHETQGLIFSETRREFFSLLDLFFGLLYVNVCTYVASQLYLCIDFTNLTPTALTHARDMHEVVTLSTASRTKALITSL